MVVFLDSVSTRVHYIEATVWCASLESGIRSYGDFCVAPNKGGCSPLDGSFLIFTKREGTACNATDQIFLLDQDGVIYHKCSKKEVCPHGNNFLVLLCTLSFVVSGIIFLFMNGIWMLKDECHLSISRHVRYVVNVKLQHNITFIYLICEKNLVKLVLQGSTNSRTSESALLSIAVICISITDAMKTLCFHRVWDFGLLCGVLRDTGFHPWLKVLDRSVETLGLRM